MSPVLGWIFLTIIYDGYQFSESVALAVDNGILIVPLPPNATHLFQPLDVAVFRPFKMRVQKRLQLRLHSTTETIIPKSDAIDIACSAYRGAIMDRPQSSINGFRETGLFPLSLPVMMHRLGIFTSGGVKGNAGLAGWLKHRQEHARNEILTLPPVAEHGGGQRRRQRVTVDICGRLVTKEMLAPRSPDAPNAGVQETGDSSNERDSEVV